ncbi:glycosyltransferase [Kribbella sandramycini]|uniref:Glycosyltransferase involved in cell wall biosynthesis n=1 Tax=Kribbella sandramycini TaxID=60450 RepID=A0A841SJM7_9ACTN|nr:glycosyltransferase involved in cell wall biosynthesis [Kribbella sandramycini]
MPDTAAIAVVVPCYNESAAVAKVVTELRAALPTAAIYVYDNNSTDDTAARAAAAGAVVRHVAAKGKGNVVRRAFADIEADVYLLIDGDDTYEAARAADLVKVLLDGPYDHVVGVRKHEAAAAYRPGHTFGNRVLTGTTGALFGREITDMLSGYRAFSRRYVKSFPALSREFEIETELTIHSLHLRVPVAEIPVAYKERPSGGESKLRTYRDGLRILGWIVGLTRLERPTLFHGALAALFGVVALILGVPVVAEYLDTGFVPRLPTAVLASTIGLIAVVLLVLGYLLDAIGRSRQETARLTYLSYQAPGVRQLG